MAGRGFRGGGAGSRMLVELGMTGIPQATSAAKVFFRNLGRMQINTRNLDKLKERIDATIKKIDLKEANIGLSKLSMKLQEAANDRADLASTNRILDLHKRIQEIKNKTGIDGQKYADMETAHLQRIQSMRDRLRNKEEIEGRRQQDAQIRLGEIQQKIQDKQLSLRTSLAAKEQQQLSVMDRQAQSFQRQAQQAGLRRFQLDTKIRAHEGSWLVKKGKLELEQLKRTSILRNIMVERAEKHGLNRKTAQQLARRIVNPADASKQAEDWLVTFNRALSRAGKKEWNPTNQTRQSIQGNLNVWAGITKQLQNVEDQAKRTEAALKGARAIADKDATRAKDRAVSLLPGGAERNALLSKHSDQRAQVLEQITRLQDKSNQMSARNNELTATFNRTLTETRDLITKIDSSGRARISTKQLLDVRRQENSLMKEQMQLQNRIDNFQYKSQKGREGIQRRIGEIQSLRQALSGMETQASGMSKVLASGFAGVVNQWQAIRQNAGAIFVGSISVAALAFTAKLVTDSIQIGMSFERIGASLSGLLQSQVKAKASMSEMFSLSKEIMASPMQLMDSAKTMLSVGTPLEDLKKDLKAIGVMANVSNQPMEQLAVIYGEIRNKDRLYREDALQFSRRGIPIMKVLGDQLGVSRDKLNDLVSEGAIKFDHFQQAMRLLTEESSAFGSANEEALKTSAYSVQQLTNAWMEFSGSVGAQNIVGSVARAVTAVVRGAKAALNSPEGSVAFEFDRIQASLEQVDSGPLAELRNQLSLTTRASKDASQALEKALEAPRTMDEKVADVNTQMYKDKIAPLEKIRDDLKKERDEIEKWASPKNALANLKDAEWQLNYYKIAAAKAAMEGPYSLARAGANVDAARKQLNNALHNLVKGPEALAAANKALAESETALQEALANAPSVIDRAREAIMGLKDETEALEDANNRYMRGLLTATMTGAPGAANAPDRFAEIDKFTRKGGDPNSPEFQKYMKQLMLADAVGVAKEINTSMRSIGKDPFQLMADKIRDLQLDPIEEAVLLIANSAHSLADKIHKAGEFAESLQRKQDKTLDLYDQFEMLNTAVTSGRLSQAEASELGAGLFNRSFQGQTVGMSSYLESIQNSINSRSEKDPLPDLVRQSNDILNAIRGNTAKPAVQQQISAAAGYP